MFTTPCSKEWARIIGSAPRIAKRARSTPSGYSFSLPEFSSVHLRDAQLAREHGDWRCILSHSEEAEKAGYTNFVDLALMRIEAWTVLSEPDRARAELDALQSQSDLGGYRGSVLLRLAEHELFSAATFDSGLGTPGRLSKPD